MWWVRETLVLSEIETDERRHLEEVLVNLLSGIIVVTRPDKRQDRAEHINDLYASIQHLMEPYNFGSVTARASVLERLIELWKANWDEDQPA